MNLIQIGTNIANDDFFRLVSSIDKKSINNLILVEPLESCHTLINKCYQGYNYVLEKKAIVDKENIEKVSFFISKYHWLSSLKNQHILNHGVVDGTIEVEVESITLNGLFEKYKLKDIDILFVDAEGMDDKIICSIDFEKYKIKEIYYEDVHIDNDKLKELLKNKGYEIKKSSFKDGLTSHAYLS